MRTHSLVRKVTRLAVAVRNQRRALMPAGERRAV
jgi:hypothetical protein